jgi:nucleoid DNA-binding protein
MNKSDLVDHVAQELGMSRLSATRLVEVVLQGIRRGLSQDQSVMLSGFGTFVMKPRKARVVRNPQTGDPIAIAPGHRVGFRMGKGLRELV